MNKRALLIFGVALTALFVLLPAVHAADDNDKAPGLGLDCDVAKTSWDDMRNPLDSDDYSLQAGMTYTYWENLSSMAGPSMRWFTSRTRCNLYCMHCNCKKWPFYMPYFLKECEEGIALKYPADYPDKYSMSHCQNAGGRDAPWHNDVISLTAEIGFKDPEGNEQAFEALPAGTGADYAVPRFSKLFISEIGQFNAHCVDGVPFEDIVVVRVYVRHRANAYSEWSEWDEPTKNGEKTGTEISCHGGNFLFGSSDNFEAYTFSQQGIYDVSVQYPEYSNGAKWVEYKRLKVVVSSISAEITPPENAYLGFFEGEGEKNKDMVWEIRNTGKDALKIKSVSAKGCGSETGLECTFPAFSPMVEVNPDGIYYLTESVSASRPKISPDMRELGVDVAFADRWGNDAENMAAGITPVDVPFSFTVAGYAFTPYGKSGETGELEPGTYYLQICTDSLKIDGVNEPLVSLTVEYDAGTDDEPLPTVASVAFHDSPSCDGSKDFQENSDNTREITLKKKQMIRWRIEGVVGMKQGAVNNYVSDWERIGTSKGDKGYVNGDVLKESLGKQIYVVAYSDKVPGSVNIDDGILKVGTYAPKPSEQNKSPVYYVLVNSEIAGEKFPNAATRIEAEGAAETAEGGSTVLEIGADGTVIARTSVYIKNEETEKTTNLALLWLDRAQYMIKVQAGIAGACKGEGGATGAKAVPRVNYDWSWSSISEDTCNSENEDYIYCDATQFSMGLVKRLQGIKGIFDGLPQDEWPSVAGSDEFKALTEFKAYLMRDGYGTDFRNDFDNYALHSVFSDTPSYYRDAWALYFKQGDNLVFDVLGNAPPNDILPSAGLYDVKLKIAWGSEANRFFRDVKPAATVTVELTRLPSTGSDDALLYYLPFDSTVGLEGKEFKREFYGVGFTGDVVPILSKEGGKGTLLVETYPSAEGSAPLVKIGVVEDGTFDYVHKTKTGAMLEIEKRDDVPSYDYLMTYSPSYATPVIMETDAKGGKAAAFYAIKNGTEFVAPPETDDYMSYWTAVAESIDDGRECLTYGGKKMFLNKRDARPLGNPERCTAGISEPEKSFGFGWQSENSGKLYLESVFYTPLSGTLDLWNACTGTGMFYSSGDAKAVSATGRSLGLKEYGGTYGSLQGMMDGVRATDLCVTSDRDYLDIWWNSEKIAEELLKEKFPEEGRESSGIVFCDPVGATGE